MVAGLRRLPADVTNLIGRTREIRSLRSLLSKSRLISVTGAGGVGKSRVAVAVARSAERVFPDGVCYLDLSSVLDPQLVPSTLAAAMGEVGSTNASLVDRVADWHGLVVLDNCEHLVEACATTVRDLLEHTPKVRVIVTSRERLGVAGEHLARLDPLPVPAEGPSTPAELRRCESVQLLLDRAQSVRPDFEVTAGNAADVAQLCRSLEGLPLAIELAAARLGAMSIAQISDYLSDPGRLLGTTWRASSDRQQSLEHTIAWSFQLCSAEERRLWQSMSVFAGPADLTAIGAVWQEPVSEPADSSGAGNERPWGRPIGGPDLRDLVDGLVSKSVVVVEHRDTPLFRLPSAIRHFGRRQLAPEVADLLRARHARYHRRQAVAIAERWFGPDQVELSTWLRTAAADLQLAIDYSLAGPDPADADVLVTALSPLWIQLSRLDEGAIWLERVQAVTGDLSARGRLIHGWIRQSTGHVDRARDLLRRAVEVGVERGDRQTVDLGRMLLGIADGFESRFDEAVRQCTAALEGRGPEADEPTTATMLMLMGELLAAAGDTDGALRRCDQAEQICGRHRELWCGSLVQWVRALVHCVRGEYEQAATAARDSLRMKVALDDRGGMLLAAEVLCWAWAGTNQWVEAARLFAAIQNNGSAREIPLGDFGYLDQQRRWWGNRIAERVGANRIAAMITAAGSVATFDEAIRQALDETASSAPAEPDRGTDGQDTLTRRETEVAELVAAGLSNREVASRLVISLRTAEVHVGRILVKLGFNSRTQIAAWWHVDS